MSQRLRDVYNIIGSGSWCLMQYIKSSFRSIYLVWDRGEIKSVNLIGIVDGELDNEEDLLQCAETELYTQIEPIETDSKIIRCDYPEEITEDILGVDLDKYQIYEVYRRYEE